MNRYGVDEDYFKKKLKLVIRDLENYKPCELSLELSRLSKTARPIESLLISEDKLTTKARHKAHQR